MKKTINWEGKWTVRSENHATGHANFVGTYDTKADAEAAARRMADRSRPFGVFVVWMGTPRNPYDESGPAYKGTAV